MTSKSLKNGMNMYVGTSLINKYKWPKKIKNKERKKEGEKWWSRCGGVWEP